MLCTLSVVKPPERVGATVEGATVAGATDAGATDTGATWVAAHASMEPLSPIQVELDDVISNLRNVYSTKPAGAAPKSHVGTDVPEPKMSLVHQLAYYTLFAATADAWAAQWMDTLDRGSLEDRSYGDLPGATPRQKGLEAWRALKGEEQEGTDEADFVCDCMVQIFEKRKPLTGPFPPCSPCPHTPLTVPIPLPSPRSCVLTAVFRRA
jgi:hypothetical protein